jgi:hypothetical protein
MGDRSMFESSTCANVSRPSMSGEKGEVGARPTRLNSTVSGCGAATRGELSANEQDDDLQYAGCAAAAKF